MEKLIRMREPQLLFGYDQALEDPRDGLTLFGPYDPSSSLGLRAGVVGTRDGINRFKAWVANIQGPLFDARVERGRPFFPGYREVFGVPWLEQPTLELEIAGAAIDKTARIEERHRRTFELVSLYTSPIVEALRERDEAVDVWFVIVTEDVYKYARPQSRVETDQSIKVPSVVSPRRGKLLRTAPSLFPEENEAARPFAFEPDFHNQLKARLLPHQAVTQIIRESTLAPSDFTDVYGRPRRDLAPMAASIAWNLAVTAYYKTGGRPWKLSGVREGVCYVGLVFKQDHQAPDARHACCAAQMFLDSGDGVVFRGSLGPWYSPQERAFHLDGFEAERLLTKAMSSYETRVGASPREVFIHGKVRFSDEEWQGFKRAVPSETALVGVQIRSDNRLRLFGDAKFPPLRGLAYCINPRMANLWTKGFVPSLQTYPGLEVPRPLLVDVCRGEADIATVLQDIMGLTKLNYNSAIFADGLPVTLRFADAIGEILTAAPDGDQPPLPFKHYI